MAVDSTTLAKATEKDPGIATENGLTGDEVHLRLEKFGPNAMPDTASHPLRRVVEKFWAPVPWMPVWVVAGTLAAAMPSPLSSIW